MQIKERPANAPRGGLLRRFRGGSDETLDGPVRDDALERVDLLAAPEAWQQAAADRIERLEAGLRLLAETMRRAFVRVSDDVRELRGDLEHLPGLDIDRSVRDALAPLSRSLEELSDAVARVPHILAAATQHVDDRVASFRDELTWSPGPEHGPRTAAQPPSPNEPAGSVAVRPFELELIDQEFDAMVVPGPAEDAREIWAEGG